MMAKSNIVGSLLGTAVGDALGLPYEGLSRRRREKIYGPPDRHRFFFGRGMISDDTEHTCMVAQALIGSGGNVDTFRRQLAWRFRFWLLGLPAGIGRATLLGILRLWIGYPPNKSGIFSAGNGPAMRAPILGSSIDDPGKLRELVRVSTRITHTDPKAEWGAFAVALATHYACRNEIVSAQEFLHFWKSHIREESAEFLSLVQQAAEAVGEGKTTPAFAESLGLNRGVSGYVYHTIPVVLHAWLSHPQDYRAAVTEVILCGGDTDTTAAIVGGIVGASVGTQGIPSEWLNRLMEWPRSKKWMERLASQLDSCIRSQSANRPINFSRYGILPRNFFFLLVVLFHGFRRLFPPIDNEDVKE